MSATYTTGKPYPPRSEWVPRVFRREGMFYVIELAEDDDLAEHARLNPGTQRIEDAFGNQLWPPPLASCDRSGEADKTTKIGLAEGESAVPHEDAADAQTRSIP